MADPNQTTKLPGAGALSDWLANTFEGPAKPLAKAMSGPPQPSAKQPANPNAVSGMDRALSDHADKLHPVK